MAWLLDTNVLSELRRPRPNLKVVSFVAHAPAAVLYVSSITLAEIRFGVLAVNDQDKRLDLDRWLATTVRPSFSGRVLEVTEETVLIWLKMFQDGRKKGLTFAQPDLFLAATAVQHGLTLVTRNRRDFQMTGVPIFNPWE
jgi:predicted nucleic acid-binding protein